MALHLLLLCAIPFVQGIFEGTLDERFEYYEKLKSTATRHDVEKRATDMNGRHEQVVSVDALGQNFRLHLTSELGLFSPDFTTVVINADDTEEEVLIDRRDFYSGYVEGVANSTVNAHWQGDSLSAVIHTTEDTYVIEPSWRHIEESDKYTMIAYRFSDMKRKVHDDLGAHYCGLVDANGVDNAPYNIVTGKHQQEVEESMEMHDKHEDVKHRYKRQDPKLTRCPVALVADYRFYDEMGQREIITTVKYLASVMAEVNQIFKSTNFENNIKYGFEIKMIEVHTGPTNDASHYNKQTNSWGTTELLQAFSDVAWDQVCLAHLFTYLSFDNGVLGLAWVAGAKSGEVGGICTLKSGGKYYNTGWSSSKNKGGNRLTTMEAYLVTAHEFGHNWGSPHDPDNSKCSPDSTEGGKYLMYTYSVSGSDKHNFKFSSCSRNTIQAVLNSKKDKCFVRSGETTFCGNYLVESGEECDAGFGVENDPCCTSNCNLRTGAICSDVNEACCSNCGIAPADTVCRALSGLIGSCYQDVTCDGFTADCSDEETPKDPGTLCTPSGFRPRPSGVCDGAGVCLSACKQAGREDCLCEDDDNSCNMCCRRNEGSTCSPYRDSDDTVPLAGGTPCYKGYCDNGVCQTDIRDLTKRLWDLLENVEDFSGFVKFMRNNIVLSVVVLSLIVYMPFVIVVLCIDYRRDKEDDDDVDWHNKDNDKLFTPKDKRDVRETYTRSRRPRGGYSNPAYENESLVSGPSATASGVYINNDEY